MSDKRVTVIKEFYPKASLIKKIEECLNDNSTTILDISNSKQSEGLKKIKDCVFVDCNKGETNELARWIKAYFNQNKIETDLQTSIQIAEFCLRDMSRIELECEKLIAYANDKGYVDSSDVELLVNRDNEYKIYNMTDCIAKKQFDKAMSIVNEMLSKGESYQMIIVAVYNYFRKLLHIRISNKSDEETAKLLGMQEFAYKKTKAQALKFGAKSLKKAIDQLCDTDYKIKSGILDTESGSLNTIFSIMISK
jgi:DNA polymerase-3 subunit delta